MPLQPSSLLGTLLLLIGAGWLVFEVDAERRTADADRRKPGTIWDKAFADRRKAGNERRKADAARDKANADWDKAHAARGHARAIWDKARAALDELNRTERKP